MKKLILIISSTIFLSFSTYIDTRKIEKDGVSLEFPSDWDIMKMEGYPILVQEKAKTPEYSPLCNFVVEFDYKNIEIENYINNLKDKFKNSPYMKDWKVISERKIKFKGLEAKEIITTCIAANFMFKTKIIIVKKNNRIINLNTSSSIEEYENNKTITNKIYQSVKF